MEKQAILYIWFLAAVVAAAPDPAGPCQTAYETWTVASQASDFIHVHGLRVARSGLPSEHGLLRNRMLCVVYGRYADITGYASKAWSSYLHISTHIYCYPSTSDSLEAGRLHSWPIVTSGIERCGKKKSAVLKRLRIAMESVWNKYWVPEGYRAWFDWFVSKFSTKIIFRELLLSIASVQSTELGLNICFWLLCW